jgi:diguanylate cyclase (GGDEF)-like protein
MNKISKTTANILPAMRISFSLALLTISLLLIADFLGFSPNERNAELKARKLVSESLAIQFSVLADVNNKIFYRLLDSIVKRNDEILTAGIRNNNGDLIFQAGNHFEQWGDYKDRKSTSTNVIVPIFEAGKSWGTLEFKFAPLPSDRFPDVINLSIYKLTLFVFIFGFFAYLFFTLRTLKHLDPSAVIPDRVNAAFDTLAEGVLILDENERIVLANKSFAEKLGLLPNALLGIKASELNWKFDSDDRYFPWMVAQQTGRSHMGQTLDLAVSSSALKKLVINCAPILGNKSKSQGVLITFNDITALEEKNSQLTSMVSQLETMQKQVKEQNKELKYLATRDPLTGCLNRRAFNEAFEKEFAKARKEGGELSFLMADIDHFKLVNDQYGHSTGDEIIKLLADILKFNTRKVDLVGRYGGEEFCVALPGLSVDEAISVAERIRLRIKDDSAKTYPEGPRVTASLGVASIFDHAVETAELIEQADKALYVAKESGRNRVIRWNPNQEMMTACGVKAFDSTVESKALAATDSDTVSMENRETSTSEINRLRIQIKELESLASKFSEELEYSKNYDNLTGLPNQTLFFDRVTQMLSRGHRNNYIAAVVTIDISFFNQINSSMGREGGDALLKRLAERLTGALRQSDVVTLMAKEFDEVMISRLGADEFGILLSDLKSGDSAIWVIKRILDLFRMPIVINEQKIFVTCNLGLSLYPSDAENSDDLIRHSLTAKQYAKQMPGQNNFQYYDAQMQLLSQKQMELEVELRRATENEEWVLFYQPKIDIATGNIKGVEALIRWNHPQRGVLSPYEFIDFAERRGFIVPIGNWVLKEACVQAKKWLALGIKDVKIAINLSSEQLRHKNLTTQVLDLLDELELPPRHLELEITETSLMLDLDAAINTLNRLHCRGITISVDDFGTGYSSLSYLKNLPIDTLKIDRSFIKEITNDSYDKNIVKTIISLAHGMDLFVIAEGVENQEQYELLKEMSCDVIQGYLFSKPLSALEATHLLLHSPYTMQKQINPID